MVNANLFFIKKTCNFNIIIRRIKVRRKTTYKHKNLYTLLNRKAIHINKVSNSFNLYSRFGVTLG